MHLRNFYIEYTFNIQQLWSLTSSHKRDLCVGGEVTMETKDDWLIIHIIHIKYAIGKYNWDRFFNHSLIRFFSFLRLLALNFNADVTEGCFRPFYFGQANTASVLSHLRRMWHAMSCFLFTCISLKSLLLVSLSAETQLPSCTAVHPALRLIQVFFYFLVLPLSSPFLGREADLPPSNCGLWLRSRIRID